MKEYRILFLSAGTMSVQITMGMRIPVRLILRKSALSIRSVSDVSMSQIQNCAAEDLGKIAVKILVADVFGQLPLPKMISGATNLLSIHVGHISPNRIAQPDVSGLFGGARIQPQQWHR